MTNPIVNRHELSISTLLKLLSKEFDIPVDNLTIAPLMKDDAGSDDTPRPYFAGLHLTVKSEQHK